MASVVVKAILSFFQAKQNDVDIACDDDIDDDDEAFLAAHIRKDDPAQLPLLYPKDCQLVHEIGRGAMGVVYKALLGTKKRQVVVKVAKAQRAFLGTHGYLTCNAQVREAASSPAEQGAVIALFHSGQSACVCSRELPSNRVCVQIGRRPETTVGTWMSCGWICLPNQLLLTGVEDFV